MVGVFAIFYALLHVHPCIFL